MMVTKAPEKLNLKSLREQVYDHLREALRQGQLVPGTPLRLGTMSEQLGVSRTPLRDALLQLAWEGFVTIHPRRGVTVRPLSLPAIRHLYEIIGGLESGVILAVFPLLTEQHLGVMRDHLRAMDQALAGDDFPRYYEHNLSFHDVPLTLSDNSELKRLIAIHRQRLYDFPRRPRFVKDWEQASNREHQIYLELLVAGDAPAAAAFMRDVHWSYRVQESYIRQYYSEAADECR